MQEESRTRINRNVNSSDIVRIIYYRDGDNGEKIRTTSSVDKETFDLAITIVGDEETARKWLQACARGLWERDAEERSRAKELGVRPAAESSISRSLQREVVKEARRLIESRYESANQHEEAEEEESFSKGP